MDQAFKLVFSMRVTTDGNYFVLDWVWKGRLPPEANVSKYLYLYTRSDSSTYGMDCPRYD